MHAVKVNALIHHGVHTRATRTLLLNILALVCMCFLSGLGRSTALAAALSIPGSINVTIEPPEAIADGARWSIDGGTPQISGATVAGLNAGTHMIGFGNLVSWLEPETREVLIIGAKQNAITVTYRPVPKFYFRAVPEQRARIGTTLEFLVHTDDPFDPQNPGPGTALQMTATPPPSGALTFDAGSGRITYTPSVADRLPFTVRLATAQALVGSFEVTPLNALALEEAVIEYDRPLPDAESRDYIQISEIKNPPELFNDATAETFTVSISGHTLVFANEHRAHLLRQYGGRLNIRELRLYADKVVVRNPLLLPQTTVTIFARELRFEGDGRIETTPRPRMLRPEGATWTNQLHAGINGIAGHVGGNVNAFVERFSSDSTTATRFVMRGGDGGPAGEGRNGMNEDSFLYQSPEWRTLMQRAGNTICDTETVKVVIYRERTFTNLDDPESEPTVTKCGGPGTAKGERAVPSGIPGPGGPGASLSSTLNLSGHAQLSGGNAGPRGQSYVGGFVTASRTFVHRYITAVFLDGRLRTSTRDETATKVQGAPATAPFGVPGAAGSAQVVTNLGSWLHSFAVRGVVQFAKDAYLNGRITEARRVLGEYQELLRAHQRVILPDEQLSDEEFAENVNLDQLMAEVETLVHRIDSNLDYFGNPAGWVPMLSFEANFLAFQNEVEHSLPILYLTYWLNNAATNLQASLVATEQAKDNLEAERSRMETSFNEAQSIIPRLKTEAQTITAQIHTFRQQITNKLFQLEQRAQDNVAERNRLPLWKKGLGVLSVVADLVPVYQPTIGRIGAGIALLAKINPDKPLESAKALAPQAFGVMSNKTIKVCFGTNAPPPTGTNAPSTTNSILLAQLISSTNSTNTTNAVKKARQERLKLSTTCTKFLGSELKDLAAIFKDAQVDDKELAAELEKLKAADTNLLFLVQQVEGLNAAKERFAQELAAALQIIGSFSSSLAENLVATHELEDRIFVGVNALDHGALMHIKEMERRARDRLMKYQYYLAKSFQYRQLRPYTGNLQLTSLLARFQQLIEANSPHVLTEDEFDNLKGIFVDELRELVAQSLDNVNAPARSFPKTYRLNVDQRRQLNEQGWLILDLKALGMINPGDENVRLADLRTRILAAHAVGGPIGSLALVRVNFEHRGVSRLTSAGRTYLFRHYQTEAVNPIVWNAIFDANTGQTVNSTLTAAQQSLISVLLALQPVPVTNLVFYSQPAANAEILLTKDVSTDNGIDFVIDDLLFEIQYDFTPTTSNLRELNVRVGGDLAPVIALSQPDINSRQDGLGDFSRMFPTFTVVTLQAPPTYGEFVFDRWFVNNQPQNAQVPVAAVFLTGNTQVEARYRRPAPLMLTPVIVAPGQIGVRFVSEEGAIYRLEQAPSLISPVWTIVDTRTGDGATIQFPRPTTATSTFFRVRKEP